MKLVKTIGAVKVFSNREIAKIDGTSIRFVGGSFCDLSSGALFINERGDRIAFGDVELCEPVMFGAQSFSEITTLILDKPEVPVTFTNHDGDDVIVNITGTQEFVESCRIAAAAGVLAVEFSKCESRRTFRISLEQIAELDTPEDHKHWHDNDLTASSSVPPIRSSITISLPRSRKVDASIFKPKSSLKFDDVPGHLIITSNGGHVRAGTVGGFTHEVKGTADTEIRKVTGSCLVELYGSGHIQLDKIDCTSFGTKMAGSGRIAVNGGKTDKLNVVSQGSGKTALTIRAKDATFSATAGHITVAKVINPPVFVRGSQHVAILDLDVD